MQLLMAVEQRQYRTNNSRGLCQLGSTPVAAITCDVTGQFVTARAVSDVILLARYLLAEELLVPSANINVASFTAADTAYPYTAGIYFASSGSPPNGVDAVSQVLHSIAAKLYPGRDGGLRVLVLRSPSGTSQSPFPP